MESNVYNIQGKKVGTIDAPANIFGMPWNADLVHQVVTSMQGNLRTPIAHTKDRGEVRGGGRKPWKQKGTGRARHGSSRSPIWRGGGVTHGPRNEKSYERKINQKVRQKALLVALSRKFKDGEIIFINELHIETPKTREAKQIVSSFAREFSGFVKKKNAALIALPGVHLGTMKSFSNFSNIEVEEVRNLNPLSVLSSKYIVIVSPEATFEVLLRKTANDTKK